MNGNPAGRGFFLQLPFVRVLHARTERTDNMVEVTITHGAHIVIRRSFTNYGDAESWAVGYCRRHDGCDWRIE